MPQTKHISPIGSAEYAHIQVPDTKFKSDGEWNIQLRIPSKSKDAKKLMEFIDGQMDEAMEKFENTKRAPHPYKEDGDDILFRFKQKCVIRSRSGQEWKTSVNVVDSKLQPIPKSVLIGNGSKVRVSYTTRLYTAPIGAGVSVDLSGVQVLDLVEYDPNQTGFNSEEGFSADSIKADEKENYSQTETVQEESGDF